jgi:hypothetical protein
MSLTLEQVNDILQSTIENLDAPNLVDIASDLQQYIALPQVLKKERQDMSGSQFRLNLLYKKNGSAQQLPLYGTTAPQKVDVLSHIVIPWRSSTASFVYDEREVSANAGPEEIVDFLMSQAIGIRPSPL